MSKRSYWAILGLFAILSMVISACSDAAQSTPVVTQPPLADSLEWETKRILLYDLVIDAPRDWELVEYNRRAEPEETFNAPLYGHDCADYYLESPDKRMRVFLWPVCEVMDGDAREWPADAVVVDELPAHAAIIRYYDEERSGYAYTMAGMMQEEGSENEVARMAYPPMLIIPAAEQEIFVEVGAKFDDQLDAEAALAILDRIVLSLSVP